MSRDDERTDYGLIAYFLVLLGAVVVGPLEAVLGLAAYSLLTDEETDTRTQLGGTH